jgi:hypothetical protein
MNLVPETRSSALHYEGRAVPGVGADRKLELRACFALETFEQPDPAILMQRTSRRSEQIFSMRFGAKEQQMSTQQIATRLAELCNKGEFEAAQKELFANDAVSIEQHETPAFPKETKGLQAIIQKGHHWAASLEKVHECSVSKPLVAGNAIAMALSMDVTMKGRGRMKLEEVCVYEVKDGKIASEQFFM